MKPPAFVAALATLAFALAGCSDEAPAGDEPAPIAPPAAPALPTELVEPVLFAAVDLGEGAGEPNIAVAPDGTIYVTPIDRVLRSTDGGRTFADTGGVTDGHGDGDIVVTPDGRLHWLGLFGEAGPIPYQVSDDQGETFSDPVDVSNGTGSDREWLAAGPTGILYASWRGEAGIETVTSFDGGATWTGRTKMSDDAVGGPLVAGPKVGQVYEAMTTFGGVGVGEASQGGIFLARSYDNATSWDTVPVFTPAQSAQFGLIGFPTSIFPTVAVDASGTLYVVFSADQRLVPTPVDAPKPLARFGVFLTSSTDQGETWTSPVLLSDPAKAAVMPFIDAGAAGRVAVAWYENTAGLPHEVLPDLWNVKLWVSLDADTAAPAGQTVQLNDQPNHIGPVCTSGTGCLAGDRSLLDFFEVTIGPNGLPVVAWASSAGGTGVGIAVQPTHAWFGGVAEGTPLK